MKYNSDKQNKEFEVTICTAKRRYINLLPATPFFYNIYK